MTRAGVEPPHLPAATEGLIRRHAGELVRLAQEHGLTELAVYSDGALSNNNVSPDLVNARSL